MKILPFIFIAMLLGGCTSRQNSQPVTELQEQSSAVVENGNGKKSNQDAEAVRPELILFVEDYFDVWIDAWRMMIPTFDVSEFRKERTSELSPIMSFEEINSETKKSAIARISKDPFSALSPDGKKAVELRGCLSCEGRFSEVQVWDFEKGETTYFVSSESYDKHVASAWIDNETFVVVGDQWIFEGPFIDVYDLSSNTVTTYYSPATIVTEELYENGPFANDGFVNAMYEKNKQ